MEPNASSTVLDLLVSKQHLRLQFYNLNYKQPFSKVNKSIIKDVSGQFESGHLSAVIGPSGAGKTTLLNVISGFLNIGVKGTIALNNEKCNACEVRKKASYIPQHFAMLDYLTVEETLNISAELKVGSAHRRNDDKVQQIINLLNLQKCRNTLVNKLSGGEKKRLSIGIELITNPPIMFLDEPTSGLDSVSSIQVIKYLKQLALNGMAVICVVQQPSSQMLDLFDDLLVMSEGQCLYCGPLTEIVPYFEKAGFSCPNFYNRADFAIEVASREHCDTVKALISENIKNFTFEKSLVCNGIIPVSELSCNRRNRDGKKYTVNFIQQCAVLFKRSLISMWRDMISWIITVTINIFSNFNIILADWIFTVASYLKNFRILLEFDQIFEKQLISVIMRVICHILVAFLLGIVYWDFGSSAGKIISNTSCMFFFVLFIFFANAMPTILSCPLETSVFIREYLNGWYSLAAYYLSKIFADVILLFICPTLFFFIAYHLTGQPIDLGRMLMFWGICLLTAIVGHLIGLVAGAAFDVKLSIFLVPASCIPMLIFSGFFIKPSELVSYLRPLTDISYFRYSLEGLAQAVYGYNRTKLPCSEMYCYYTDPNKYLDSLEMAGERYGVDIMALGIWILILLKLLYMVLFIKVRYIR